MDAKTIPARLEADIAPASIDNAVLDAVGLTQAYRDELDSLTRFINSSRHAGGDVVRFARHMFGDVLISLQNNF